MYRLINKIIDISIGGEWGADAIGYFQKKVYSIVISHTRLMLNELTKRSEKNNMDFWRFIFDSPFEGDNNTYNSLSLHNAEVEYVFKKMYKKIKRIDIAQAILIQKVIVERYGERESSYITLR